LFVLLVLKFKIIKIKKGYDVWILHMKNLAIAIILVLSLFIKLPVMAQDYNYAQIYKNIPKLSIEYVLDEDPDEETDYEGYYNSPYPLMRTSSSLYCGDITVKEGYYLLTPRVKDGHNVVLFKQRGRIVHIVPVYEKRMIDPLTVYKMEPKPEVKWYAQPWNLFKKGMKKLLGKKRKPLDPPKSLIETRSIGPYYAIDLYYDNYVYKMLFSTEKQ